MSAEPAPVPALGGARLALVVVSCLVAAIAWCGFGEGPLLLPAGLLFVCALLAGHRALSSQLLVRAVIWCNLLLGFLMSLDGSMRERPVGCAVAVATGVALLALGRRGLEHRSERFSPAAYRGSLVLAMVMALADTQSLTLFGMIRASRGDGSAILLLACAGLMIVALVGLYRLQVWGLALNIAANVLIAGLALTGSLDVPEVVMGALCLTALVQLALPLPLLVAMVRGKAPQRRDRFARWRAAAVPAMVVSMLFWSIYGQLTL